MSRPCSLFSRYGTASLTQWKRPFTFVSNACDQSSKDSPATGPGLLSPALATTMSTPPNRSAATLSSDRTDSGSRTSACSKTARSPR